MNMMMRILGFIWVFSSSTVRSAYCIPRRGQTPRLLIDIARCQIFVWGRSHHLRHSELQRDAIARKQVTFNSLYVCLLGVYFFRTTLRAVQIGDRELKNQ